MPSRIHAGVFRAFQTQPASEPADLSSSAPSKEAVDLGTVRAPQSREVGKPGHGLPICRVDCCIYRRPERRPKVGAGVPFPSPPLRSSFTHT